MECSERAESITALIDGELPAAERAALESHLKTCSFCARALEDERAVAGRLRALPQPSAPAGLRAAVMARVATAQPPSSGASAGAAPPRGRVLSLWPWIAGGVGLAAGVLLLLRGGSLQREREVATAPPSGMLLAPGAERSYGQDRDNEVVRDAVSPAESSLREDRPGEEGLAKKPKGARPEAPASSRPHGEVPEDSRTRDLGAPPSPPAPAPTAPKDRAREQDEREPANSKESGDDAGFGRGGGGLGGRDAESAGADSNLEERKKSEDAPPPADAEPEEGAGLLRGDRGGEGPEPGGRTGGKVTLEGGKAVRQQTSGPALVAVYLRVDDLDAAVRALDASLSSKRDVVRERAWMRPPSPAGTVGGIVAKGPPAPLVPPGSASGTPSPEDAAEEKARLFEESTLGIMSLANREAPPGQRVAVVRMRAADLGRMRQSLGTLPGFTETHAVVLRDPDAERRQALEAARARGQKSGAQKDDGGSTEPVESENAEEEAARAARELLERASESRPGAAAAGEPVPPPRPDAGALRGLAEAAPDAAFTGVALGSTLEGDGNRDLYVEIHLVGPGAAPTGGTPPAPAAPSGGK